MGKKILDFLDQAVYEFLNSHENIMPKRFGKWIALYYTDARIRKKYAKFIGVEMGEGTYANLGMNVVPSEDEICVHIGKNVSLAPNITFLGGTEPNNGNEIKNISYIKQKHIYYKDIFIEDEAWIGTGTVIFPGVRIGRCSVIGAGSIVMEDVPSYSIYAGVPAKRIRSIKEE